MGAGGRARATGLAEQDVLLTVPASCEEARELTGALPNKPVTTMLRCSKTAGRLYAWLESGVMPATHQSRRPHSRVRHRRCTTDFSLLWFRREWRTDAETRRRW
jgi:hypothetical protein